jgi:hypothetical protein
VLDLLELVSPLGCCVISWRPYHVTLSHLIETQALV